MNDCVRPTGTEAVDGDTAMDARTPAVRVAVPVTPLLVAVMVEVPVVTAVASPPLLPELTVATAGFDEFHTAVVVRSAVDPSLYLPLAVNCCVVPTGISVDAGLTTIETSMGGVTVNVADPVTPENVAEMITVPVEVPVARPVTLIVADEWRGADQVTVPLRSAVLPSLYVPVAVNCCERPATTEAVAGVTTIFCNVAVVVLRVAVPLSAGVWPLKEAVIVVVPAVAPRPAAAVASPLRSIVATAVFDDVHVTFLVRSTVLWSEKIPVAMNCCEAPSGITVVAGVTSIEMRIPAVTFKLAEPLIEPSVAVTVVLLTAVPVNNPAELICATDFETVQTTDVVRSCVEPSE